MPHKPPRITKAQAKRLDTCLDELEPDAKTAGLNKLITVLKEGIQAAKAKGATWQQINIEAHRICDPSPEHFAYLKGIHFNARDLRRAWEKHKTASDN